MFEIVFTSQSCQSLSLVTDILTPLLSTLVGGIMTFAGIRWQAKRDELKDAKRKREELAKEIGKVVSNLQIVVINSLNPLSNKTVDESTQDINAALAASLVVINQYLYCLPNNIQEAAKNFFDKTRTNVYKWQKDKSPTYGQILDRVEATNPLSPYLDQSSPEGEACQAYENFNTALRAYTTNTSKQTI